MDNYEYKITVIIPIYNAELYLEQCINSILSQTLKEIEIICVNDGSTDKSADILDKYHERNQNIKILFQKNSGSGIARNNAMKIARGEYVAFCDADDFYASGDVMEKLYCAARYHHADICGGNILNYGRDKITNISGKYAKFNVYEEGFVDVHEYQNAFFHQKYIFRRKFLYENSLCYPDYLRGQDPPFMAKALECAKKIYLCPINVYVYRTSHKIENYNQRKAEDVIKGYMDTLCIALDNMWEMMFQYILQDLIKLSKRYWLPHVDAEDNWSTAQKCLDKIEIGDKKFSYKNNDVQILQKKIYYDWKDVNYMEAKKISGDIIIYGAGKGALHVMNYLNVVGKTPRCFVVSSKQAGFCINGIRVISIEEFMKQNANSKDYQVIIGAIDIINREEMEETLIKFGIDNIIRLDMDYMIGYVETAKYCTPK